MKSHTMVKDILSKEPSSIVNLLVSLSKSPEAKYRSSIRTSILRILEGFQNSPKFAMTPIEVLGQIPLICSKLELYHPELWRNLGTQFLASVNSISTQKTWILSNILYNYSVSFPYMPRSFYEGMEEALMKHSQSLTMRSLSQSLWSLSRLAQATPSTLAALEQEITKKHRSGNKLDFTQISFAFRAFPSFGATTEFQESYGKMFQQVNADLNLKEISNVAYGLAFKGSESWMVKKLHVLALAQLGTATYFEVKELAKSFNLFHCQLEVPFYAKLSELKKKDSLDSSRTTKLSRATSNTFSSFK